MDNIVLNNRKLRTHFEKGLVLKSSSTMAEGNEDNTREIEEKSVNVHNVIYTIKPAILFEYCCGIFRFSVEDKKLLPAKRQMKIYSVVIFCIVTTLTFLNMPESIFTDGISFIVIIEYLTALLLIIPYLIFLFMSSFLHSKTNIRIIQMFAELDEMLNIVSNTTIYRSSRIHTIAYLIIIVTMNIGLALCYILTTNNVSGMMVASGQLHLIHKLEILVFCKMIGMLKHRLHIINGYLTKFIDDTDNNKHSVITVIQNRNELNDNCNWIGRPSHENTKIHDLALAYDHVGTICELINNVFNFIIFMILITTFECIIVTIWSLLHMYLSAGIDVGMIVDISSWITASMLNIIVMAIVCETLLSAREKTMILVNRIIMNYDLPKFMRNQAKAFLELIEVWPLSVSVYDMFAVDITLVLKFISVATTYLIVIIQISHFI